MPDAFETTRTPDLVVTTVTFAVNLTDAYTGKRPLGPVKVALQHPDIKYIKNPSGYYVFVNIPKTVYKVTVESDFYLLKKDVLVKTALLDPLHPVLDIVLDPIPSYPFPTGTTLIRGVVFQADKTPVPGAAVRVKDPVLGGLSNSAATTEKGEFVLYFKGLSEDNIKKVDGKRFLKAGSGTAVSLEIKKKNKKKTAVLQKVAEGQTTVLKEFTF
ncbi:MAG: carboxypeptidase regulatory-like domain-containing protein [bacterium]|nr:carboxypeptidase regulatory-like domain-containing protein [bacterium]